VLLDHAYVELAEADLTARALAVPNVLVFRTLSKAWGCAGLRVVYVVGRPDVVSLLRRVGQPYPVSRPSLLAAKLAEEAGELASASAEEEVAWEAADLLYFALVRLVSAGVPLRRAEAELDRRRREVRRSDGSRRTP